MRKPERPSQEGHEVEVDRLARKLGKYTLVVAVAKRARQMKERAARMPLGPSSGSYIERALRDVAEGRVKVKRGEDE